MIEDTMPLKERKRILKHLQTKTTTFTQLHVLKDAVEAHEKLEKIEQIVSDYGLTNVNLLSDDLTDFEKDILREVLEQE